VATAEDGEEALRVYEREKPTLILLDIMIPEKSGYTSAGRSEKTKRPPS